MKLLKKPPPICRAGVNADAFIGGFRLWEGWDLNQIAAWKKDQLNRSPTGAYVIL